MSEKGVLSKSIASNISEAIIDKLGGTGYAPAEWSRNINLLGISSADIEEALASITEDTSSADKGLLSLSIASDVGAMLNKKYNTSRGFKPCEVSSAVSALTVLPEKTASSAPICTFNDGADDVPLKSCEVALSASLDGYSSVDVVQTGKNLLPDTNYMTNYFSVADNGVVSQITTGAPFTWSYASCIFKTTLPAGTYTAIEELVTDVTNSSHGVQLFNSSDVRIKSVSGGQKTAGTYSSTFTLSKKTDIGIVCKLYDGTARLYIVSGSTATAYEPYVAPTTHTANLGRTIYGGTVDVVKGEGEEVCGKITYNGSENWNVYSSGNGYAIGLPTMERGTWYSSDLSLSYPLPKVPNNDNFGVRIGVNNDGIYVVQANTIGGVTDLASFKAYLSENPLTIIYPLATPTDFTFEPVEINTRLGNNTMWSEQGNTEVTYRADLDLYEAPSTLLGSNNTETEGNEEQEVNE